MFTQTHLSPSGSRIWFTSDGYFNGRMHTNSQFAFAYKPTFQDLITSRDDEAWFNNKGNPIELDSDHNGTIDVPNLFGGFNRGVDEIPMPTNSYSQQNAALGLDPSSTTPPNNATINAQLGLGGSGTPPAGIYLPNSGGTVQGGIYVQGDLDQCRMYVDSLGRQVYRFTQGSTTKTITVDKASNVTYLKVGTATTTYNGVPRGVLYTKGMIEDLGGPDRIDDEVQPALANGTRFLVTATDDIVIQNDLTYQDYDAGNSILGIFADDANVRVGTDAPDDMNLDAFVMATGDEHVFTVDNYSYGSPRGTFHLRGGMITDHYGAFYTFDGNGRLRSGYARNFSYDRRGLAPPYFPTTNHFQPDIPSARTVVWKEM
jgi:hypothetical protein